MITISELLELYLKQLKVGYTPAMDIAIDNMLVAMNGSGYNVEKYHKKIEEIRNEQKKTQPEIRYRPTGLRQLELMLT